MPTSHWFRSTFSASLLLAGLVSVQNANAALFDYAASVNVATAPTLPSNPPGFGSAIIAIGNGNSLTFNTNSASGIDGSLDGGADINFGTIVFNPSLNSTSSPYAVEFNYLIQITDVDSGFVGLVNFTGEVSGTARGTPKAINSKITDYTVTPGELILGNNKYIVSVTNVIGPGSAFDGVLQGNIQVIAIPEASTLVLGGLGMLASISAVGLRKRFGRA